MDTILCLLFVYLACIMNIFPAIILQATLPNMSLHLFPMFYFTYLLLAFSNCNSYYKSSKQQTTLPSQLFSSHNAVRSSSGTPETKLSCWSSAFGVLCSLLSGRLGRSWIFMVGSCNNSTTSPNLYCSSKPPHVRSNSTPAG